MKSRISWRGAAAVVVCCIGLVAALLAFRGLRSRDIIVTGGTADRSLPASPGLVSVEEAGAEGVLRRISDSLHERLATSAIPAKAGLEKDASAILRAWLQGSAEDYLAYLATSGDQPPPAPVWADPAQRAAAWQDSTKALREASFDPDRVTVRAVYERGVPVPLERIPFNRGSRFDKLPGFKGAYAAPESISAAGLTIQEVRVPVRLNGRDGQPFNGLLGLSYGWNEGTSRWTLVEVTVYGVPTRVGGGARIPPL